jgi:signal peptidase I
MAVMDLSSCGGELSLPMAGRALWQDGRSNLYHQPPKAGKHAQDGRMSKPDELAHDEIVSRRSERRVVILATSFGFLMFLCLFALVPGVGPILRVYTNPTASMMPTIRPASYSVVSRASYGYSRYSFDAFELPIAGRWPALMPQRGDVVVFRLPRDHNTQYLKRVVGLPGDRIQMIKGRLSINGALVPVEPAPSSPGEKRTAPTYVEKLPGETSYLILKADGGNGPSDNTPEFLVPAGNLFVLGDNRDNSSDSRHQSPTYGVGFVPVELVIGRVIVTF